MHRQPSFERGDPTGPMGECLAATPAAAASRRRGGIIVPPPGAAGLPDDPEARTAPAPSVATPTVRSGEPTSLGLGEVVMTEPPERTFDPSPTPAAPTPASPLRGLPPVRLGAPAVAPAGVRGAPRSAALHPLRRLMARALGWLRSRFAALTRKVLAR